MSTHNPFPGMNPFLERHWSDVDTALIAYIRDEIAERLPLELTARSEEGVTLSTPEGQSAQLRADVAVVESWKKGIPPSWKPSVKSESGVVATEPQFVMVEETTERWIEISDKNGQLVTVIEVLSPSNKGRGQKDYLTRQRTYLTTDVNLVEIDLLRGGDYVLAVPLDVVRRPAGTSFLTCVSRTIHASLREVYVTPLFEPLPNIRVPLRPEDDDVILELQPLIDRCYKMGGYWNADQQNVPGPPLPEDEAKWVADRVMEAGLTA